MALPNMTARPATAAEIQAQIDQLNANFNRQWDGNISGMNAQRYQAAEAQRMAQQAALSRQAQAVNGTGGTGGDRIEDARKEAYGLARGAVSRVNPIDQMILQALQERSGKDAGPFDATTRNALLTQAADAAGQAALNQRGRIQGSASDPSVQAANNEAEARRQQAIQQANLGINTQASVANYDARGQALSQLGNYNQQVQGNQTDNERWLQSMLMREMDTRQVGTPGIPTYQQFTIGGPTRNVNQPAQQTYTQPAYTPYQPAAPYQPSMTTAKTVAPTTTTSTQAPTRTLTPADHSIYNQSPTWTATGSAGTMTGENFYGYTQPFRNTDPRFGPVALPY